MLFRLLSYSLGVVLVFSFAEPTASAADETLTPEEFLKVYRAAVNKQISQIVDYEMDTVEKIPRRGNYHRTIFVRASQEKEPFYANRGDLLQSQDTVPSQDIFTRVHLCYDQQVTVLLRRASPTNPFEIYYNDSANGDSIQFSLSSNVDVLAYASFAWFGQSWLDYFEIPDAITGIEESIQDGVKLVDVSFQLPENTLIAGQRPTFQQATVTFEPERDWVFRRVRIAEEGVVAGHDPTLRIFFQGAINDYKQYAGMWLPTALDLRRTTRDQEGNIVDDAIQSAEIVAVRVGSVADERFDLKTYGLGVITEFNQGDEVKTQSFSQRVLIVLILNLLGFGLLLLFVVLYRRSQLKASEKSKPEITSHTQ